MRLPGFLCIIPLYYGEEENFIDAITSNNPWRDKWELDLGKKVLQSDIPVLGICRGIQILNVCTGGTLYQSVKKAGKNYHASCYMPAFTPSHTVRLSSCDAMLLIHSVGLQQKRECRFYLRSLFGTGMGANPHRVL